jgi:predicted nucleic acid-binding protein
MKIIADTSIWSLALTRHALSSKPEIEVLRKLIEQGENIFLLGIILQEILQGVKEPSMFKRIREHFDAFPLLEITREIYVKAAELKNHLGKNGIQTGTIDALIAAAAISNECYLFTSDKDFTHIAKHSKLKLLKIP